MDDFLFSSLDVDSHLNVLLLESCHVILKDSNVVANVTMGPRLNYYKKLQHYSTVSYKALNNANNGCVYFYLTGF